MSRVRFRSELLCHIRKHAPQWIDNCVRTLTAPPLTAAGAPQVSSGYEWSSVSVVKWKQHSTWERMPVQCVRYIYALFPRAMSSIQSFELTAPGYPTAGLSVAFLPTTPGPWRRMPKGSRSSLYSSSDYALGAKACRCGLRCPHSSLWCR